MGVTVPHRLIEPYPRFSLYNSPYPAHDDASGIDLYPDSNVAISPVEGVVRGSRTVGCPDREYAVDHDHVIAIDVDDDWATETGLVGGGPLTARVLHVDPSVERGDRVTIGDALGEMVRSGFFGPWVDNHVHLEFRDRDVDPYRASGSHRLTVGGAIEPVPWDGTGNVVETGSTYVRLDSPRLAGPHRSGANGTYAGLASDDGIPLDGGLTHYGGGGAFLTGTEVLGTRDTESSGSTTRTGPERAGTIDRPAGETLSLLGEPIGAAEKRSDNACLEEGTGWTTVTWRDVAVYANGDPVTGLSLFLTRRSDPGIKIVWRDHGLSVGDEVTVSIRPTDDPIRLGPGR
ncbi:hypothetical protein SAMN05192561_104173 [Halopenitus malekzadehii]|uniref:Peptidase family M23 n=1 Tax=Halopenitus malekzadehii TaxID=1267564 RepID=A0A1H6IUM7_9EURY|nr:hypothetical protein [Halopenitus malekzadehii]SEH52705.1 hypothetical protein SAMN05192561_104173 [Halopenitus malekzadehii]